MGAAVGAVEAVLVRSVAHAHGARSRLAPFAREAHSARAGCAPPQAGFGAVIRDTLSGPAGAIGVDLSLEERASTCRAVAASLRSLVPALREARHTPLRAPRPAASVVASRQQLLVWCARQQGKPILTFWLAAGTQVAASRSDDLGRRAIEAAALIERLPRS